MSAAPGRPVHGGQLPVIANVSLLFAEHPYTERFQHAANAGFTAVETWWPWATPAPEREAVDAFVSAIDGAGVELAVVNFYAGDMPAGDRGIISLPDREADFTANLESISKIAQRTGCSKFNALYGQRCATSIPDVQDETAVHRLRRATERVAGFGGTVLIEPLGRGLNGAYPLETAADGAEVVERVRHLTGSEAIALLFDTFHLATSGSDFVADIDRFAGIIGHVQIADAPGRGEPGTGDINLPVVIDQLWAAGYRSGIALEYKPTLPTEETLGWLTAIPRLAQLQSVPNWRQSINGL